MKCKRCGSPIHETEQVCMNCGTVVASSLSDFEDDVKFDDEKSEDAKYMEELDNLLNSHNDNNYTDAPDYSSFANINEPKKKEDYYNSNNDNTYNFYNNYESNVVSNNTNNNNNSNDYKSGGSHNLVDIVEEEVTQEDLSNNYVDNYTNNNYVYGESDNTSDNKTLIPFKVVIILLGVVLVILVVILGVKVYNDVFKNKFEYKSEGKDTIDKGSKLSLKKNPNYIKNHAWVCVNGDYTGDLNLDDLDYFQYDFKNNGRYVTNYPERDGAYEAGEYYVSLDSKDDNYYYYKLTMVATLENGYQTLYKIDFKVDKEGKKAINTTGGISASCEELDYYNSRVKQ